MPRLGGGHHCTPSDSMSVTPDEAARPYRSPTSAFPVDSVQTSERFRRHVVTAARSLRRMPEGDSGTLRIGVDASATVDRPDLISGTGLTIERIRDPASWLSDHADAILLTTRPDHLHTLAAIGRVILLGDDPIAAAWARSRGASTLPSLATPGALTDAIAAVAAGQRVTHPALLGIPAALSPEHAELYQVLVDLCHVTAVAERIGYSRTETYRRLASLYRALRVTNREQALYLAGLLHIGRSST